MMVRIVDMGMLLSLYRPLPPRNAAGWLGRRQFGAAFVPLYLARAVPLTGLLGYWMNFI
jgi:hypothetical protein